MILSQWSLLKEEYLFHRLCGKHSISRGVQLNSFLSGIVGIDLNGAGAHSLNQLWRIKHNTVFSITKQRLRGLKEVCDPGRHRYRAVLVALMMMFWKVFADFVARDDGAEPVAQGIGSWSRALFGAGRGQNTSGPWQNAIQAKRELLSPVQAPAAQIDMALPKDQWLWLNHMTALFAIARSAVGKFELLAQADRLLYLLEGKWIGIPIIGGFA
jgi:hypothetical protein